ncbi:MAG: PAS domain S-box protein [Betaproteobacteria bacterium]|nr:PAS domain S-box protein [Betaproteobacteria bacterium]
MAATDINSARSHEIVKLLMSRVRARWGYAIVLSLASAAVIVTAVPSYRAIDRELTDVALSRRAAVAQLATVTLSEKFDHLIDISISLATRVRFRQLVAAGQWAEAIEILRDVPRDLPAIERLFLTDTAGTLTADVPELPGVRGQSFAYRDWYKGVSRDGKPYVSPAYQRAAAPQVNVFAVAAPIRSAGGNVSGVLVLQIRLDTFFEWLKAIEIGLEGFAYVVDSKGQIAFHSKHLSPGEILDFSTAPLVQKLVRGERGVEIAFDPFEQENSVSAYAPVAGYGWGVVAQQPTRTAFAAKNQQLTRLLIAYGLTLLFFVSGIYLASRIMMQRRQAEEDHRIKAELERRVAERTAQLSDSEERHRAVVDTAVDAIIVIDERSAIQRFNPGAERMFGYSEAEVAGKRVSLLMPSPYRAEHDGYVARYLATGEKRVIGTSREVIARRKDGTEFPADLAVAEMRLGESRMFTGIIRDITEAKRAAEQKVHLMASLEATNKELESFSYSVSHDLRSPLRAVDGYARIVEEDYAEKLDDEGRRLLKVIRDNSGTMGELIDDLLVFSRLGRKPLSTAAIDMTRLVEEVLDELRMSGERPPGLMIGALPPARGDATLVKQAWANLLGNAIKFSSKREQPVIEVSGHESGTESVYCVKDNGAGFDMQYYNKLFGVFQRLHSADEFAGTGVGLAIVQRVVTRHGGRAWAEGKVDEGAAFYFSLPRGRQDGQI